MDIASKLQSIIRDSLFRNEELTDGGPTPENAVLVEGIVSTFGFHPERLASHKEEIAELIRAMPKEFMADSEAKGHSFLQLCMDKDGNQWGEHRDMEALIVLAIATNQGKFLLPRAMWDALPGGMPYVSFSPTQPPQEAPPS